MNFEQPVHRETSQNDFPFPRILCDFFFFAGVKWNETLTNKFRISLGEKEKQNFQVNKGDGIGKSREIRRVIAFRSLLRMNCRM